MVYCIYSASYSDEWGYVLKRQIYIYKCRKLTAAFCVYYFKTYEDLDLGLLLGTEEDAALPAYTTVMQVWRYFSAGWLCRAQLVLNCNTSNHAFHVQYALYFRRIY